MVSSTPFYVVASQSSQMVFSSSATGPSARPTPVEMAPEITSTLLWRASLRNRSTVSLGLDSSSTTSSILRPRMPPAALMRSVAYCTPRRPDSPTGAVTPAFAASTPIFTGPLWAWPRPGTAPASTAAPPIPLRKCRRDVSILGLLTPCFVARCDRIDAPKPAAILARIGRPARRAVRRGSVGALCEKGRDVGRRGKGVLGAAACAGQSARAHGEAQGFREGPASAERHRERAVEAVARAG